eukprot:7009403-Prymnesium_polylepis.1
MDKPLILVTRNNVHTSTVPRPDTHSAPQGSTPCRRLPSHAQSVRTRPLVCKTTASTGSSTTRTHDSSPSPRSGATPTPILSLHCRSPSHSGSQRSVATAGLR